MATLEIKMLHSGDSKQYKLNDMDDVMEISDQFPSMGRFLVDKHNMHTITEAMLKYLNSHSSMHATLIGQVTDKSLKKSEIDFKDQFHAWLKERSVNPRLYDTGYSADPGDQRKPDKKQSWLKTLFNKVGIRED